MIALYFQRRPFWSHPSVLKMSRQNKFLCCLYLRGRPLWGVLCWGPGSSGSGTGTDWLPSSSPSAKYAGPASRLTGMCSSLSYWRQLCCRQYPWILYNHQLRAFPGDYVYQECEELFVAEINIITVYRPARVGWTFNPTSAKHSYKEFIQVGNRIEAWSGRPSDELCNWQPHHFLPTNQRGPGQASSSSELDLLE